MKLFNNLKFISFIMLGWFAISASAQMVNSAYFTESYDHRHIMNPACAPQRGVIDIPVLSNINIGMNGNFGLGDFLYKYDDPFGEYDLVNHGLDSITTYTKEMLPTLKVSLNKDGSISGDITGTWEQKAKTYQCTMEIDGVTFKGVFFNQFNESEDHAPTMTFSLIGNNNESIWGSKLD